GDALSVGQREPQTRGAEASLEGTVERSRAAAPAAPSSPVGGAVTMGPQAAPNPGPLRGPFTTGPQAAPNPGPVRGPFTTGPQAAPSPGPLRGPWVGSG